MHRDVRNALEAFEAAQEAHWDTGRKLRDAQDALKAAVHAYGPPECLQVNVSRVRAYIRVEDSRATSKRVAK